MGLPRDNDCRNIAIPLIDPPKSEAKAQTFEKARLRQLITPVDLNGSLAKC
jgi:hypothetical protein